MVRYDRLQDQINLWLIWVIAMTVGCAAGWAGGEALGRLAHHRFGWTIGHFVAWSTFEISVWTLRWQVLRHISTVPVWRRLDSLIWSSSEVFAWSIGEGFHQLSPTLWLTASAVWGVIGGAAIWFVVACARQAKPGRWFVLTGTVYGLLGITVGIGFLSVTMVFAQDLQRAAEAMAIPLVGWLLSGALLGATTGAMTGLAVARLWLRMLTP